jgi:hypothetical protein
VVTELATNAVLFATPPFWVRLSVEPSALRVEIHDNSTRLPRPRDYGVEATTGRGLKLVIALCDDWGVTPNNAGKMVWATVRADEDGAGHHVAGRGEEPSAPPAHEQADVGMPDRSSAAGAVDKGRAAA